MLIADNKKYLIVDTLAKNNLNPIYIFIKATGKVIRTNKEDLYVMLSDSIDENEIEISQLCFDEGLI